MKVLQIIKKISRKERRKNRKLKKKKIENIIPNLQPDSFCNVWNFLHICGKLKRKTYIYSRKNSTEVHDTTFTI